MTDTLLHYPNECYRNLNEYEFAKGLAELGLKSVPSAQPEQKWILCRERLPEKREMVIIWIDMPKQPFVQQSIHMAFAWLEPDARTGELHWMDRHFTKIDDSKVIAWMPVPERYQPQPNEVST